MCLPSYSTFPLGHLADIKLTVSKAKFNSLLHKLASLAFLIRALLLT